MRSRWGRAMVLAAGCAACGAGGAAAQVATPPPTPATPVAAEAPPTDTPAAPAELVAVPFPELGQLEASVAHQIADTQELLRTQLGAEGAGAADRGAAYGTLGQLYQAYGFTDSAEACYRNAATLSPRDFRWVYYLGTVYQGAGLLDEAADAYRRALGLFPDSVTTRIHLAEVEIARNRPDEAEPLLEQALTLSPDLAAAEAGLGQVALAAGRYQEAIDYLEKALAQVPAANRLHYLLAMAYRGLGDEEKARAHLAQRGMVGVRAPDPLLDELEELKRGERVRLLRGQIAFRAGRYAEAVEAFRDAVEANPDSVPARVNLGAALRATGDRDGAVAQFRAALERDPDNATAHFNLGSIFAADGAWAEAASELSEAVDRVPDDAEAHRLLAEALRRTGRAAESIPHFAIAARLAPQNEVLRVEGAATLADLGRFADARRVLEAAQTALPASGVVAHALARLLAASPDLAVRDGARALDLAQRVFAASPTPEHGETLALAFAETGHCQEAAGLQRQLVDAARRAAPEAGGQRLTGLASTLARYENGPPCRPPAAR